VLDSWIAWVALFFFGGLLGVSGSVRIGTDRIGLDRIVMWPHEHGQNRKGKSHKHCAYKRLFIAFEFNFVLCDVSVFCFLLECEPT